LRLSLIWRDIVAFKSPTVDIPEFNELFWNEELGFYAYTLDGDKKPVFCVASNPGRCLWSGIVPKDRAARLVARLMHRHVDRLGYPHALGIAQIV
jgi:glycogen debranching enzyme